MGFSHAAEITVGSYFGLVAEDHSYNEVQCQGDESSLDNCNHSNQEDCGSNNGAGVYCSNEPTTTTASTTSTAFTTTTSDSPISKLSSTQFLFILFFSYQSKSAL